jgi:hypothetical protein
VSGREGRLSSTIFSALVCFVEKLVLLMVLVVVVVVVVTGDADVVAVGIVC